MTPLFMVVLCFAMLVTGLCPPGVCQAQVIIRGGGKTYDRAGIRIRPYSTFPSLIQYPDDSVLCYDLRSSDGGRTWNRGGNFGFPLGDATRPCRGSTTTLSDGTILVFGRYTWPHEREKEVFVTELFRSRENFASYDGPQRARISIPHAVPGTDEYGQPAHWPP